MEKRRKTTRGSQGKRQVKVPDEKRKRGERLFAEDTASKPDLSKRTGSSELSGEAAARLFEKNQDRARGRAKEKHIHGG